MANTIQIVITAKDQASGVFSGVSGALGGLSKAILPVAAGAKDLAGGFALAAKAGLDQIISHERLSQSLTNLAARELQATSGVEKMIVVGKEQVGLTKKQQKELNKLNDGIDQEIHKRDQLSQKINIANQELAKLESAEERNETAIQRKRLQIEDLTYKYNDLNSTIDQHQERIKTLTNQSGAYVDVMQKVREGQITMDEALAQAAPIAEELTRWVEKLGIQSPFNSEQIGLAFKTAMAYGFTMDEAKKLTAAEVDFASAMGAGVEVTNQIALALGQMRAKGKVSGQELIQLTNAGIGVNAILQKMGFDLDDVSKGLVDSDAFIQAVIDDMNIFEGAGKRQANTWAGLTSTMGEVKDIALREFFTGMFDAIQPYVVNFTDKLQEMLPTIKAWGDAFGQWLADAIPKLVSLAQTYGPKVLDVLKNIGSTIMNFASGGGGSEFVTTLVNSFMSLKDWFIVNWPIIQSTFLSVFNTIKDWFVVNWPIIQATFLTTWEIIKAVALAVADVYITQILPMFQEVYNNLTAALNAMGLDWSDVWSALWEATKIVIFAIGAIIIGLIGVIMGIMTAMASVYEHMSGVLADIASTFMLAMESIAQIVGGVMAIVKGIFTGDLSLIKAGFESWKTGVIGIWTALWQSIINFLNLSFGTIFAATKGFIEGAIGFFQSLYDNLVGRSIVPEMMSVMLEIITQGFSRIVEQVKIWLDSFISTVREKLQEVASYFTGLKDKIIDAIGAIDLSGIAQNIMQGLIDGIINQSMAVAQAIQMAIEQAIQKAKDALGIASPSTVFMNIGQQMMSGMALGISGASYMPAMATAGAVSNVTQTTNYYFNQTVNTRAETGTVVHDFETARASIGLR